MTRLQVIDTERCVGCQLCMYACQRRFGKGGIGSAAIFVRSRGGMGRGFRVVVCRACSDPPCAAVCPVDALRIRKGGGVILQPNKCIGCGHCQEACTIGAIFWDDRANKPVICMHCGYCANFCPHGVIALVKEGSKDVIK